MKDGMSESRLRAIFGELRRRDEALAPEFRLPSSTLGSTGASRAAGAFAAAAALLAAAVTAVYWPREVAPDPAAGAAAVAGWSAPTDFLLRTPGDELMQSVSYDAVAPVTHEANETRR
jgi:hypothetical protein